MLPRLARAGLVSPLLPVLGLLLVLSGCGSSDPEDDPTTSAPSKALTDCREKWKDLSEEVDGRDAATTPSTLPRRWQNVAATLDYYATSASKKDCGSALTNQKEAMSTLTAFSARTTAYDMQLQLAKVRSAAQAYASSAAKPAQKGAKGKKKAAPPPTPQEVGLALVTLNKQAPVATQQQGPAWQQASVIDLDDKAAVAKALKDLAFLSSESAGYRAARSALAEIQRGLASTR